MALVLLQCCCSVLVSVVASVGVSVGVGVAGVAGGFNVGVGVAPTRRPPQHGLPLPIQLIVIWPLKKDELLSNWPNFVDWGKILPVLSTAGKPFSWAFQPSC